MAKEGSEVEGVVCARVCDCKSKLRSRSWTFALELFGSKALRNVFDNGSLMHNVSCGRGIQISWSIGVIATYKVHIHNPSYIIESYDK